MSQDAWHTPWWVNVSYTNCSVTRGIARITWDFPEKSFNRFGKKPYFIIRKLISGRIRCHQGKKRAIFGLVQCMAEKRKHLSVSFGTHLIKEDLSPTAKGLRKERTTSRSCLASGLTWYLVTSPFFSFNASFCLFPQKPNPKTKPPNLCIINFNLYVTKKGKPTISENWTCWISS